MHHSEQKCAHFCSGWSIVGYGTGAFWYLCKLGHFSVSIGAKALTETLKYWDVGIFSEGAVDSAMSNKARHPNIIRSAPPYDKIGPSAKELCHVSSQVAKILGSMSIRHWSDTKVSDRCLVDIDPRVFVIWVHTNEVTT